MKEPADTTPEKPTEKNRAKPQATSAKEPAIGKVTRGTWVITIFVALLIAFAFAAWGPGGYTGWVLSTLACGFIFRGTHRTLTGRAPLGATPALFMLLAAVGLGWLTAGFGPVPAYEMGLRSPDVPTAWEKTDTKTAPSPYYDDNGPQTLVVTYTVPSTPGAKTAAARYVGALKETGWDQVNHDDYRTECRSKERFDLMPSCSSQPYVTLGANWTHLRKNGWTLTIQAINKHTVQVTTLPATGPVETGLNALLGSLTRLPQPSS